jgi:hypothetical protein
MSDDAPEVTFSLPKISSSATRPPIMMARREVISCGHRQLVALGQLHDHAQRAAARDDRRLVHRIGRGTFSATMA